MSGTKGVLYVATGAANVEEAAVSAASLKVSMPGLPSTLVTDVSVAKGPFDSIVHVPTGGYDRSYTIRGIMLLPYEQTLYLDSDTYICGELDSLFSVLDKFDMAGVTVHGKPKYEAGLAPESFPQVNGGVLAFRRNDRVRAFLASWLAMYESHNSEEARNRVAPGQSAKRFLPNQPSLRESLFCSDLRFAPLRSTYNCRLDLHNTVEGPVRILHGGHSDLARIAREVNAWHGLRTFYVARGRCVLHPTGFERRWNEFVLRTRKSLGLHHRKS